MRNYIVVGYINSFWLSICSVT